MKAFHTTYPEIRFLIKKLSLKILRFLRLSHKSVPDGHFYSPVVDRRALKKAAARVWPEQPTLLGIDFNERSHEWLLNGEFPGLIQEYDYPDERPEQSKQYAFYTNNSQFGWLDARVLFCMLRIVRPRRMIEIGSGFSSLLTADVNKRFLHNSLEFTCIEPYPRAFLSSGVPGIGRVLVDKVENVPLSLFEALGNDDILFIDSSHVAKTGSDVNHIYFEIAPRLKPGVIIHIHDIFLPADYPQAWVIDSGISWNEQYLVKALLMYSKAFSVVFGCNYAYYRHPESLKRLLEGQLYGGGSLWVRKIA